MPSLADGEEGGGILFQKFDEMLVCSWGRGGAGVVPVRVVHR